MTRGHALALLGCACAWGCSTSDPGTYTSPADASVDVTLEAPFLDTGLDESKQVCLENDAAVSVDPDEDRDHDGWSVKDGDCNDCDPNANPGAFDVASNLVDEDCNGIVDDEPGACDGSLEVISNEAMDGARAIGLCRTAEANPKTPRERRWGVLAARYELADGTLEMNYASHGLLPNFGPNVHPQQGATLLALSSGAGRRPGDVGYTDPESADMKTSCATPAGWPKQSPSCNVAYSPTPIANDSAALRLQVRVPTNARSLSFRFAFYTAEFPKWVCNQYNDFFVALLDSTAKSPQAQDGNISFDSLGNPISVNSAFLEACLPQVAGGKPFACLLGDAPLLGTGFEPDEKEPRGHGATGWLETTAAVTPGEDITLRFAVWDGGDHLRASTVLIDALRFAAEPAAAPYTVRVPAPR